MRWKAALAQGARRSVHGYTTATVEARSVHERVSIDRKCHSDIDGFYTILNVDPTASEQAIRIAFRQRAKELHPDVSPDHTSEFILLKRAYDMLSNPGARIEYDRACVGDDRLHTPSVSSRTQPYPPSAPRSRVPTGSFSSYVVAFTLMTAVASLLMGYLFVLYGSPPPLAPSVEEVDSGKFGPRPNTEGRREEHPESTGARPRSDNPSGGSTDENRDETHTGARRPRSWWE